MRLSRKRNRFSVGILVIGIVFILLTGALSAQAAPTGKNMYLVIMELVEEVLPRSPEAFAEHLEKQVIPSHEALIKLMGENKVLAGGPIVGRRAELYIIEAASNLELNSLLRSLPVWPLLKVEVTPLYGLEGALVEERQLLELLKAGPK